MRDPRVIFSLGFVAGVAGKPIDRNPEWSEIEIRTYDAGYGKGYTERYQKRYRATAGTPPSAHSEACESP